MLYLDNSATTKVLDAVKKEMIKYLDVEYGNPNAKYYDLAVNANKAVENARKQVSELLNCSENELFFTSGATESNNTIIKGYVEANNKSGKHLITSMIEHSSVYEVFKYLESKGYEVTYLYPDKNGFISPKDFLSAVRQDTIFASIVFANSELGSINDIEEISAIAKEHNVFFHTDATQAIGKTIVDLKQMKNINSLSLSAHKFNGPKGIGVLFVRNNELGIKPNITPLIHGGEQEQGFRAGTLPVHNIVGLGAASSVLKANTINNIQTLSVLEDKLKNSLLRKFGEGIEFHTNFINKLPGIINFRIKKINNQILLKELSPYIAASTGSACSNTKPSRILQACGYSLDEIRESIRFSLSPYQNEEDLYIIEEL